MGNKLNYGLVGILAGVGGAMNSANADILRIYNISNNGSIGGGVVKIQHDDAYGYAKEGQDFFDALRSDAPNDGLTNLEPNVSPYGVDLSVNMLPANSTTPQDISFKVSTNSGGRETINASSKVIFTINPNGTPTNHAFDNKPITFQQYDPSNPDAKFPIYDVNFLANKDIYIPIVDKNGNSIVVGVADNGEVYANANLRFDRNLGDLNDDSKVDSLDLALFADNWLGEGFGVVGDISGKEGLPDNKVDMYDFARLSEDWMK